MPQLSAMSGQLDFETIFFRISETKTRNIKNFEIEIEIAQF